MIYYGSKCTCTTNLLCECCFLKVLFLVPQTLVLLTLVLRGSCFINIRVCQNHVQGGHTFNHRRRTCDGNFPHSFHIWNLFEIYVYVLGLKSKVFCKNNNQIPYFRNWFPPLNSFPPLIVSAATIQFMK